MQNDDDALRGKSYEETLASDIYNMIQAAKGQGLDMSAGFQNEPIATPDFALRYMFYGKKDLMSVPGTPASLKKRFGTANVLAAVVAGGKIAGIHLLCAFNKPFDAIAGQDEVFAALDAKAVAGFSDQMRKVLAEDMDSHLKNADNGTVQ